MGVCLVTEERFKGTIRVNCTLNCVARKFIEALVTKLSSQHEVSYVCELQRPPDVKGDCEYSL